jgi:hypothetical protein
MLAKKIDEWDLDVWTKGMQMFWFYFCFDLVFFVLMPYEHFKLVHLKLTIYIYFIGGNIEGLNHIYNNYWK